GEPKVPPPMQRVRVMHLLESCTLRSDGEITKSRAWSGMPLVGIGLSERVHAQSPLPLPPVPPCGSPRRSHAFGPVNCEEDGLQEFSRNWAPDAVMLIPASRGGQPAPAAAVIASPMSKALAPVLGSDCFGPGPRASGAVTGSGPEGRSAEW